MMTDEQLNEIEALANAATPGPWELVFGGNFTNFGAPGFVEYCEQNHDSATPLKIGVTDSWNRSLEQSRVDATLIITMRQFLPLLIAEVRRLRVEVERLKIAIAERPSNTLADISFREAIRNEMFSMMLERVTELETNAVDAHQQIDAIRKQAARECAEIARGHICGIAIHGDSTCGDSICDEIRERFGLEGK